MEKMVNRFSERQGFLQQYDKIISGFSALFDINERPPLFLVDSLPDPFSNKEWDSMSVDHRDQENLSLPSWVFNPYSLLKKPSRIR